MAAGFTAAGLDRLRSVLADHTGNEKVPGLVALVSRAQPGERWMYNTGASVLGVLIARAAGQPIAEVMRTRLFEPLGMHDTAFWTSQTDRGPDDFVGSSWAYCQQVLDSGVFGWDGGLGTSWMVDPNNDLVVIVLTQRMFDSPELPPVHAAVQQAAYQALA